MCAGPRKSQTEAGAITVLGGKEGEEENVVARPEGWGIYYLFEVLQG